MAVDPPLIWWVALLIAWFGFIGGVTHLWVSYVWRV